MVIGRLTDFDGNARTAVLATVRDIFFESSVRKTFADDGARERFWNTWTGWYRREAPHDIWLAYDEDGRIQGYLTGCRDSAGTLALFDIIPKYGLFADLFAAFPAHFHLNIAEDCRGHGIGAILVERFVAECASGVHLVTGVGARNVPFYRRCGFTHAVAREGMLLLGRSLPT